MTNTPDTTPDFVAAAPPVEIDPLKKDGTRKSASEMARERKRKQRTADKRAAAAAAGGDSPAKKKAAAKKIAAKTDAAPTSPRGPGRPSKRQQRADALTAMIAVVGTGVAMANEYDGTVILDGAPALADSLAKLAESNSRVAKALDAMLETSDWGAVAMAAGGIVLPILANHQMAPAMFAPPVPTQEVQS